MAMVTIKRGKHKLRVSKNAFEKMYKQLSYRIVEEDETKEKEQTETKVEEVEEQKENEEQDVDTIPISEMNKEQLMKFAEEHNIDTTGARNVKEARRMIQNAVKESKL